MNRNRAKVARSLLIGGLVLVAGATLAVTTAFYQQKAEPAKAATCTVDALLVNSCRPWIGAAADSYPQVSGYQAQFEYHEQRVGRKMDLIHTYHPAGSLPFNAYEKYFLNRPNTYLFMNWKPTNRWADAGGSNASVNSFIDKSADAIKAVAPKKLFVTVHHEPENDVSGGASGCSSYKGSAGTAAEYRAMWRNVYNRFNARGVTNVVWAVDYMNYAPWDCMVDDLYPGNDIVDWVVFNAYGVGNTERYSSNVRHFYDLLTNTNSSTNNYLSKTWGIVEWNANRMMMSNVYRYYDEAKASVEKNEFPKLKMYMIYDDNPAWGDVEDRIMYKDVYPSTGNTILDMTRQEHYKAFANSPAFSATSTAPPPPPPAADTTPPTLTVTAPAVNATVSGTINVTANASDSGGVKALTVRVDGVWVATDASSPYSFALDTKKYGDGAHTITVRAFDAVDNMSEKNVNVTVKNSATVPAPVINTFIANPATVTVGQGTTLSWTTTGTLNCSVSSGPQNVTVTSWRTPTFTTTGVKTFTLSCKNSNGTTVSKQVSVTVNSAPTAPTKPVISADKTSVTKGGNVLINWSTSGATSCTLYPTNVTVTGNSGSRLVSNLQSTTTFYVICKNSVGTVRSNDLKVTVTATPPSAPAPVIHLFAANPTNVSPGGVAGLIWSTNSNGGACSLTPSPLTSIGGYGVWYTPPLYKSTTFTLACKNSIGQVVSKSVSVTVNGQPAPAAPLATLSTAPQQTNNRSVSNRGSGREIINTQVDDTVTQGESVTLDSTNVVDKTKMAGITKVEYYVNDKLVTSVGDEPYALNTQLLGVGTHAVTERVYYEDGSESERTQLITVLAAVGDKSWLEQWLPYLIAGGAVVVLAVVAFLTRKRWTSRLRRNKTPMTSPSDTQPPVEPTSTPPQQ